MEKLLLPTKIDYTVLEKPNTTRVTIEPLFPGYGLTIGNALRRVLLSSLEGGAVTAFKIAGVQHEFSTVPYVKEDVINIMMNLKKLRLKVFSDEEIKLNLRIQGERPVLAGDIEPNSQVEIANKDLVLATLTNKNAHLEMEIFVKKGRGYWPTESRQKEKLEIGTIAVDSLFNPVRNVGMKIEDVRVGQMTNYNRLTLDIETDGTIDIKTAIYQSADILMGHFNLFTQEGEKTLEAEKEPVVEEVEEIIENPEVEIEDDTEEDKPAKKRGRPKKGE